MLTDYERQLAEGRVVNGAALASPLIALRRLSTALAGTNLDSHTQFLFEGEKYRYAFVQSLNRLHTSAIKYENDRDQRVDSAHWDDIPRFGYAPEPFGAVAMRHALPAFALLCGWLLALCVAACLIARRLERTGK